MSDTGKGLIVACYGNRGFVDTGSGAPRNYILKGKRLRAVCGDRVAWESQPDDDALLVTGLEDRHNVLERMDGRGLPETIAAKIDRQDLLTTIRLIGTEQSLLEQTPTDALLQLQEKLQAKITRTLNEITAETHSRLVFGLGCTTLILIGIALGIIYKGGHLLSAFGISSIPAVALIVCIMAGKNMIKNVSTTTQTGTLVMWIGLAVLSSLALVIFRKLLKT